MKKKSKYKPLLFTTTVRSPERVKGFLKILYLFDNQILTDKLAEEIMGEIVRYGLYRPMKKINSVKDKWNATKGGEFSNILLSDLEVENLLLNNPQRHKEAGFAEGWPSRFATIFDFAKELGFVYYWQNEKIEFSRVGVKLVNSINIELKDNYILVSDSYPEFEQQAFLHALVKSQRNNPFVRVLNENVSLLLLLQVIKKINADKKFSSTGISKLELPLILFWKDSNADELYKMIKIIRKNYGYTPSWEVIVDICVNKIMGGDYKTFKPKSVMVDYPDEFIRKMRLTGLISLRGAGRFIDINKNELERVDYILETYSEYEKFNTEREYYDYMAKIDENLISFISHPVGIEENNKFLDKWNSIYSFKKIKNELIILSKKGLSKDDVLKYLSNPVRLEFLTSLAVKSQFPNVNVVPNYPCNDEGIPTSTARGGGNQGDIECYENKDGILIEVTMAEGRTQTMMEIWPITRHLEKFGKNPKRSMCFFVAPSIFIDSKRQIEFVKEKENLSICPKTIEEFLDYLEIEENLYL